jgi:DNA-binding CsgD family transcriptional regulator
LEISRETARNQLKAVFVKTATHRQGELVALLSGL